MATEIRNRTYRIYHIEVASVYTGANPFSFYPVIIMISATKYTMRFGGKILFENASFQLLPKNHYGLVGPNGSGKSTLIKLLAGEATADSGEIAMPANQTLGVLKQDHFIYDKCVILDIVIMGKARLWEAIQRKESILKKHDFSDNDCHELAECEKIVEELHGYSAQSDAAQILEGLGIDARYHQQSINILSGGYKLRVLLAQLLFSDPDVLLLDEPTNHLDIFSIRWLEQYLQTFKGMLVLSSHDRHFLNAVCTHIIDIDYGTINVYKGNYDLFEKTKAEELSLRESSLLKQEKRREELMGFVDRFGAKATKAAQAQSRLKTVEKLDAEMESQSLKPSSRRYPKIHFDQCRPSGAVALKVAGLSKSYGDKRVLNDVTFEIERGERVAFVGANGIGKSTLLEILMGNIVPDQGSFEWGFATYNAYFPQDHAKEVNGKESLLDWLGQFSSQSTRESLQQVLARSLFSGDDVGKSISVLSGGEVARLILAKMMLIKHNVLIFDEPTNHLDMEAIEILMKSIEEYPGTILFVSHNRHFIEKLAKRVIEINPNGVKDFRGTYEEYSAQREIDLFNTHRSLRNTIDETATEKDTNGKQNYQDQKKLRREQDQLKRKIEQIEKYCHEIEQELHKVNLLLCSEGYYQKTPRDILDQVLSKKESLEEELNAAFGEWETLSS